MDPLPLEGFTVGVAADHLSDDLLTLLHGVGATCVYSPLVETRRLVADAELRRQLRDIASGRVALAAFLTRLGVASLFDTAEALGLLAPIRGALVAATVIARTPEVQLELLGRGVPSQLAERHGGGLEVARFVTETVKPGDTVVLCADGAEAHPLQDLVVDLGAEVITLRLYVNQYPADPAAADRLVRAICEGRIDALAFTTRPAIRALSMRATELGVFDEVQRRCMSDVALFTKGPVAQAATTEWGLGESSAPEHSRLGAMVGLIATQLAARRVEVPFPDGQLRLQGSRAWVDGQDPIDLTPRECGVLTALASDPGVVWSKFRLLDTVWPENEANEHAVEVTVGRLRNRLGEKSHWVKTISKRGYGLAVPRV